MSASTEITVVGAGPYGLSIGAHLARIKGLDFRIIGKPMHAWLHRMPKGMHLKSAGFASNLYDAQHYFSLKAFYQDQGLSYDDFNVPVPLDVFCSYGLAFQKQFLPNLLNDHVVSIRPGANGFMIDTQAGESFCSRHVIIAVGIDDFSYTPEVFGNLPHQFVTHSSEHHDLERFHGKDVVVIGGGASAIDIAVLLHEAKARVVHLVRKRGTDFGGIWREFPTPFWTRMRSPVSAIGPGWRNRLCTDLPWAFSYLPDSLRMRIVQRHLGPSGGWFMAERAAAVPRLSGCQVEQASIAGGHIKLRLASSEGGVREILADHVIAATGFRVDLNRLGFLSNDIRRSLRLIANYPRLQPHFESSVPGLYFVGPITAGSFGPVMRFVAGSAFTAGRMHNHFSRARPTARLKSVAPLQN